LSVVDEGYSRGFAESAEGRDPGAPFAIVSAGLLALGGLALLSRSENPARRRRSFGLLAILASVALYLLRPKPTVVEPAAWVPFEEPASAAAPEPELSIPQEPDPEPEELLPAAEAEEATDDDSSGWQVIAEAREQGRARVDSSRPFVLIQSDESDESEDSAEPDEAVHVEVVQAEAEPREPVEGIVNRVGLYSGRTDDALEADWG
jgi:hypothetical protein